MESGSRGGFAHGEGGRVAQNDRRGKSNAFQETSAGKFFIAHTVELTANQTCIDTDYFTQIQAQ
jgi:hypothetical protein